MKSIVEYLSLCKPALCSTIEFSLETQVQFILSTLETHIISPIEVMADFADVFKIPRAGYYVSKRYQGFFIM